MTNSSKLAWSVDDFAEDHSIAPSTVWNEIRDEELETMSAGDRTLITPEMRERWIVRKTERARQRRAARAARQPQPAE